MSVARAPMYPLRTCVCVCIYMRRRIHVIRGGGYMSHDMYPPPHMTCILLTPMFVCVKQKNKNLIKQSH